MTSFLGRIRTQGLRLLALAGLLVLSGVAIGLAAAYPLTFVNFNESNATRLDQVTLAGQVDADQALVTLGDLPKGWTAGDAALGGFGMMSTDFCGEKVEVPAPASDMRSAVFSDPTDQAVLIAQAVHVDKWQSAKTYVNDVRDALGRCSSFYRSGPTGKTKVKIKDPSQDPPIADDFVAATYVDENGSSVQEWAVFVVGDVIISVLHSGPTRPEPPFLNGVIGNVLARVDPKDFAPGGIAPDSATEPDAGGGSNPTTTLGSGAADETGGTGGEPAPGAAGPGAPSTSAPAPTTAPRR